MHRIICLLISFFLVFGVTFSTTTSLPDPCPCANSSLCAPLNIPARKEVFIFSTNSANFDLYDFNKMTTIAVFGDWNKELLCMAHSKNVRVVFKAYIPFENLLNITSRQHWMNEQLRKAQTLHADGINIDIEYAVRHASREYHALTEWVREARDMFHEAIKGSQVTFDVAWSPNCIDGRCYDYINLATSVDFLFVMSYDEQSQMRDTVCMAKPNSGANKTTNGIEEFLALGIKPDQLVAGLPWYGYDYPCLRLTGNHCLIEAKPFRGVNCSDAAGTQKCYEYIMKNTVPRAIGGVQYDDSSCSPFLNYFDRNNRPHQVWFDDAKSLRYKYSLVNRVYGLRGVGIWNADCGLMDDVYGAMMWQALPSY